MIKKMFFVILFINVFDSASETNKPQEDNFKRELFITVTNGTQDPMEEVAWQSGGGTSYDVLNGKQGSFKLSPNTSPSNSRTIVTPGDCLDFITVKSQSTGATAKIENVCQGNITIVYEGEDVKNQKLVFKINKPQQKT